MVDPVQLTYDISADVLSLALPGLLWAIWFLFAFEHDAFGSSVGFGRKAFWLLLPGALLASIALLPLFPVHNDWLAISLAGAGFPLLVIALSFDRFTERPWHALGAFLLAVVGLTAILLALVLPPGTPLANGLAPYVGGSFAAGQDLLVTVTATVAVAAAAAWAMTHQGVGRTIATLLALTGGVLILTFLFSTALPGVGIEENFPVYLIPPIGAGAAAVAVAPAVFPRREALALPLAYASSTFGVLIGADVLRQPPLYGPGSPAGLYSIGGAGVLDLVYLSGLLGLVSAYAFHRALGRGIAPVDPTETVPEPPPTSRLIRAFRWGVEGRLADSLAEASRSARDAARQASRLVGNPPSPDDRPWQGLPVPGWVVSDDVNLASAARQPTLDGPEAYRGWLTARYLVNLGREIGSRRFATPGQRAAAFGIDLAVIVAPFALLWWAIAVTFNGDLTGLVESVPFNAAAYGFIALAFLYFVVLEEVTGRTVGKGLLGLAVRDRALAPPRTLSVLVRNSLLLPTLSLVGIGVPVAVAFLVKGVGPGGISILGVTLPGGVFAASAAIAFVVGGLVILGALGLLVMVLTSERQRLGDVMAGTWVIRAATPAPPAGSPPPGPGRSG